MSIKIDETNDPKKDRFKDADWYKIGSQDIIIGGTGGIGSWLALFLGRIGHNLYLFDNDEIDQSNMAGQFYSVNQIGTNKAEATTINIEAFCGTETEVSNYGLYTEDSPTAPIVMSCFDNMNARKLMFEKWAAQEDREVFIDGRMQAETGMIFIVQKGQEDKYRAELFEDSEIEEAPCSYKATSHCGALIASLMTSGLNNYLTNKHLDLDIRVIPFRFDFELQLFNLKENLETVQTKLKENVCNTE